MGKSVIGFHYSVGGNKSGIGEFMKKLNSTGVPFLMKGTDDAGLCFEGQELGKLHGVSNRLIYRLSTAGQRNGIEYDVPDYAKSPRDAAEEHWGKTVARWPRELDQGLVWMEPINEPRAKLAEGDVQWQNKHPVDWLGSFMVEYAKIANGNGFKVCGPSFNSGEPEVNGTNNYELPGMLDYLRYCAANPGMAALSIHEYIWDRWTKGESWPQWYPNLWGRVEAAMAAADKHGLSRDFAIFVTEWGFAHEQAPRWPECEPHLTAYNQWAARWPQVMGVAAWTLQSGWGSVDHDLQSWFSSLADYAVNRSFDAGPQPARTHPAFGNSLPGQSRPAIPAQPATATNGSPQPAAAPATAGMDAAGVARTAVRIKRVAAPAGLWLRSGPSTVHDKILLMEDGTAVEVLEEGEWDLIRLGGMTGYSSSRYLVAGDGVAAVIAAATTARPVPPPPVEAVSISGRYSGPSVTFVAGLHGPGDAFTWHDGGFRSMMTNLGMAVKFMSDGDRANWYGHFRKPELDLVRVFWKPDSSRRKSGREAWNEDIRDGVMKFYNLGARHFEVHNEPSLPHEGMGHQWNNGAEFGTFLRELMQVIKENCPEAKLWYPGESPGVPWTNQFSFSRPAYQKVADLCYGICQHAYSGNTGDVNAAVQDIVGQVREFRNGIQVWDKPVIVSECSVNRAASPEYRAKVYAKVSQELRHIPGLKGVFWYVSHWNAPENERANAESWYGTPLPDFYKRLTS